MLMKRMIAVIMLSLAVLLNTSCAAVREGGHSADNGGDSYSQRDDTGSFMPPASSGDDSATSGAPEREVLTPPEYSYCNINGTAVTDGAFVYTNDPSYGEMFSLTCYLDGGSVILMLAAFVPENMCGDNVVLNGSQLSGDAFLYYLDANAYSVSELLSSQDKASFSNMEFVLYDYSPKSSAIWGIKADVVDPDGSVLSFDTVGGSDFFSQEQIEAANSSAASDGTCSYCHGVGKCTVCSGLGYWYVGGTDSPCTSCGGSGVCYYCEGTGIQVWLVRGVRVS